MPTQTEKAHAFRALHDRPSNSGGAFIIPNPWDIGTARLLAHLGFRALATTSAGCAFALGRADGTVGRDLMLAHVAQIAAATDLPVSADLENGYGDSPQAAAETIRLAAAAGAVGGSIEDATGRPDQPLYPLDLAVARIRAAAAAARTLPFPFTLTARAENFLVAPPGERLQATGYRPQAGELGTWNLEPGTLDSEPGTRNSELVLQATITRLKAYQEAGADVLYAPGLRSAEEIRAVVQAVNRPVNVLAGLSAETPGAGLRPVAYSLQPEASSPMYLSAADLSALGVRRISIGSALSRAALGAFLRAAREMHDHGTFTFAEEAVSYRELMGRFTRM